MTTLALFLGMATPLAQPAPGGSGEKTLPSVSQFRVGEQSVDGRPTLAAAERSARWLRVIAWFSSPCNALSTRSAKHTGPVCAAATLVEDLLSAFWQQTPACP